jgi:hypothetical protein
VLLVDLNDYTNYKTSRAYTSTKPVTAISTDYTTPVTTFLLDKRLYIVPRNIYLRKTFALYYYDVRGEYSNIKPYVGDKFSIYLNLVGGSVDTLLISQSSILAGVDCPQFKCSFNKDGEFNVLIGNINEVDRMKSYEYYVIVSTPTPPTPQFMSLGTIILIIFGCLILIICAYATVVYVRHKRDERVLPRYDIHNS